jgi:kinesin family protein 3/17/kinesin family protein 11
MSPKVNQMSSPNKVNQMSSPKVNACLRAAKKPAADHMPFSPLDSKLNTVVKDAHLTAGAMSPRVNQMSSPNKVNQMSSPKVNQMSPNYIRELRA